VNVGGNTPLHVAASRNSKEATKWLLQRGADVNKVNKSGKKPLDMAVQANCTEVCGVINSFKQDSISKIYLTLALPPPRYAAESSSEYDGIVQSVLSALSSSIGKEYTPALHYTKTPVASVRVKSTMPLRKTIIQDRDSRPSITSSPFAASPLSGTSSPSGSAKRESFRPPPPPVDRSSIFPESSNTSSANVLGPDGSRATKVDSVTSMTQSPFQHQSSSSRSASKSGDLLVKFSPDVEITATSNVPGTIEEKFEEAWKKVGAMQDTPRMMLKLKAYLSDKAKAKEGTDLDELLGGLEQVEAGVCIAADEMSNLRKENERLLAQLNKYVQI
jgi:Ankyrin repeats (many copies)